MSQHSTLLGVGLRGNASLGERKFGKEGTDV